MQGLTPSLNMTAAISQRPPSPPTQQMQMQVQAQQQQQQQKQGMTTQTMNPMDDLAVRLEQQKLMLRQRAQLVASAEQGVQSKLQSKQPQLQRSLGLAGLLEPAIAFNYSAVNSGANIDGGMDALLRHKALLNAKPAANWGLPAVAVNDIDAKNGLFVGGGVGQGQGQGLLHQPSVALGANQATMTLDRINALRATNNNLGGLLPAPTPPPALGGGLLQIDQVTTSSVPSAALSLTGGVGAAGGGDALLALQRMQQQNARPTETQATVTMNSPPAAVPASLAHLQPQPLKKKKSVNKRKKKPADKPKRPLSAYNLFFRDERARILESIPAPAGYKKSKKSKKTTDAQAHPVASSHEHDAKKRMAPHGKIGFENLAKIIGKRWQDLSEKEAAPYKARAEQEMAAYRKKLVDWAAKQEEQAASRKNDAAGSKKRKSLDEETDDLLASVQKKVKQMDDSTTGGSVVPLASAHAACF